MQLLSLLAIASIPARQGWAAEIIAGSVTFCDIV
jgi:hypothetical protein